MDIRKCAVDTDNLAIFVQPLLAVFDENGNRQNPEPSADFIELREIILSSRHRVETFAEACLVLPGIDTLATNRFSDLLHLTHSLDSAASLFPSKPNFIVFNLYGSTSNFGNSIVVSPNHLSPKFRRYFDVAIPVKSFVKRAFNPEALSFSNPNVILIPQPYGSQFPSTLTYKLQTFDKNNVTLLSKCSKDFTCIDGKEVDYFSILKTVNFVIINEESIGFDHILMYALKAEAIPLFVTDLIIKPFEDFIDWSLISLTFSPNKLEFMFKVIKNMEKADILKIKAEIKKTYVQHFSSFPTVIKSALALIEQRIIPTKVQPLTELFDLNNLKNSYIYSTDYLIAAISHKKTTSDDKLKWMLRNFLYTQTNVSTILLVTEVSIEHIFEEFIVPSNPLQIEVIKVPSIKNLPHILHSYDPYCLALILDSSYPYTNIDEEILNTGFTAALSFPHRISQLISDDICHIHACPVIAHTSHLQNIRVEFNLSNNNLCFPISSKTSNTNLTWISCLL
uniref:Exostosin GT47 domain-containing protein n=1 Tax=Panagrolaimus davidi TaxID=227884 RepID=A0A914QZ51_9BILA